MKRNSFSRKKVKSLTLGEKLQELRQQGNVSVQELSREINIKVPYIISLEQGKYNNLPTKVYVKGYVRSYARFFGVSEGILLNLFEKEYNVYNNINNTDVEETVNRLPALPRFVFTPKIIIIAISFTILMFVSVYLYLSVGSFMASPWLVVDSPLTDSIVDKNNIIVAGKTKSNSKVSINGQQIFVDAEGKFEDTVNLSQGINEIVISSVNKFDKESAEIVVVDAQYEVAEDPGEDAKNISLVIGAQNEPVWINIVADDVEVYNDTIQIDDQKIFRANKKMLISSSSGSNTLVSYDNGDTFESIDNEDVIIHDWVYEGEIMQPQSQLEESIEE